MPDVAELKVNVSAETKELESGLKRANSEVTSFASGASKMGSALGGVAKTVAVAGTAFGALAVTGLGAVVKTSSTFSHAMSEVGAAVDDGGASMKDLSGLALSLGKDVQLAGVDATEAAQAIAELARGGVSVGDLMGGAAKGGLLLFSAGASSVEAATSVAVKAMTTFNKTGADVPHIADLLAAGANKSATSVDALGQAFSQSAAVANNAGLSIEELTGTLAFLAQRGLEGSDAGTSLKTALQRLQAPTDEAAGVMEALGINVRDAQGQMLPMAQIADILQDRLGGLSDAQRDAALQTLFGADAIRVGLALMEGGGEAISEWTAKVDDAGYAARVGAQRNNDLFGSFEQLKATIQTGAIEIGQRMEPALRRLTDAGTELIDDFLSSPEVQRGLDQFAQDVARGIDSIVNKLKDPAFQQQMKEWATAALDVGKAVASLAKDVADTLGPPLKAAVGWFNDLDEGGKKAVVGFGLVAGSVITFRDELKSLLTVGNSVIRMFAEKEAAKKTLTAANEKLAGSATKTGTAMTVVRAGAKLAATTLLELGVATAVPLAGAALLVEGSAALANAMDQEGNRAKELTVTRQAMAFAAEHGATAENQHAEAFNAALQYYPNAITSANDLAAAWNWYVNRTSMAGQSTAGLTLALTAQQQAQLKVNQVLGEGLIAGQAFNNTIVGMSSAATMLASTLPGINQGFATGALAASSLAVAVQPVAAGLIDINTYGTTAQTRVNELAGELIAVTTQTQAAAQAMAIAEQDTGEFGTQVGVLRNEVLNLTLAYNDHNSALAGLNTENSRLGGYLSVLQQRWNELDEATENGKHVTAEQRAEYERLAPVIQYLNGVIGENKNGILDHVIALVGLEQQLEGTGIALETLSGQQIAAYTKAIADGKTQAEALTIALGGTKEGASGAAGAIGGVTGALDKLQFGTATIAATKLKIALDDIPETVKTEVSTPGVTQATTDVNGLATAINNVPKSFTVTATVDISGALAEIDRFNRNLPHSPAKEGPFKTLPNWAALFESWGPALDAAIKAFEGWGNDVAKKGAETVSSVSKAITDALGASKLLANFNTATGTPSANQLSWLRDTTSALIGTIAEAAASWEKEALDKVNQFSDAVGKVGGSIKDVLEGLRLLARFDFANDSPTGNALAWFVHLTSSLVATFAEAAAQFEEGATESASAFAEAAGKVGGSVKGALEGLQALARADWAESSPSGSAMGWFTFLIRSLVQNFADAAGEFAEGALESASDFADAAGKVGGSVKNALEGLTALATADWAQSSPSGSAMAWFTHLIASLVQNFAAAAKEFTEGALGAASAFAEAAGKVAGVIGPAVDGFAKLATLSAPSESAINNLAAGIRAIVAKFAEMATMLDAEGTKATGDFAEAAGKALGAAKTGVELFAAMAGDKDKAGNNVPVGIPSAKAIDELAEGIKYVIRKFREMAEGMEKEGIAQMQTFASAAGQVLSAAKTGTDLFKSMEKLAVPSAKAIDFLLGTIGYIINKEREIANGIGQAGLAEAQNFATGTLQVIATINAALDSFKTIEQFKGIPAKMLEDLHTELGTVLKWAHDIFLRSEAIKAEAQFFANNLKEAVRLFNEGMNLGRSIPSAPPTAPTDWGPYIPKLSAGGIALKPTLAVVGDAPHGEAIIPLSRSGRMGGGGDVYIVFEGDVYGTQEFDRRVQQAKVALTKQGRW